MSIPKILQVAFLACHSLTELKLKLGWSWGIQGLLDYSSFKPGCPDLVFRVVVLLLQEGGGDLWMPHGLQGIQAEVFIHHLQKQQCCERNLMLKRILSEEKLR